MRRATLLLSVVVGIVVTAVAYWGNRCVRHPQPHGGAFRLCYSWFVPLHVVEYDREGRVTGYDVLDGTGFRGVPEKTFTDLFGSGRISEVQEFSRLPNGTWLEKTGISTEDDGKVDLELEVEGLAHPMDGRLRLLQKVDKARCGVWHEDRVRVAGKTLSMLTCSDPQARSALSPLQASELLARLSIIHERERAILPRFAEQSQRRAS